MCRKCIELQISAFSSTVENRERGKKATFTHTRSKYSVHKKFVLVSHGQVGSGNNLGSTMSFKRKFKKNDKNLTFNFFVKSILRVCVKLGKKCKNVIVFIFPASFSHALTQ